MAISKTTTDGGEVRYRVSVYYRDLKTDKKKYVVRTAKTVKEATLVEARLKVAVERGDFNKDVQKRYTFRDLYNEWWPTYILTVRGSTQFKTERIFSNHLLPVFGDMMIDRITTNDVQKAVNRWAGETEVAYKQRFIYTKKLLEYATKRSYLDRNPAVLVTLPKKTDVITKSPVYWDREQLEKFFACINPDSETYIMMKVFALTGLRREEVIALRFSDIDFNAGVLNVTRAIVQGKDGKETIQPPKSAAGYRTVPLLPELLDLLTKWRDDRYRESGKNKDMYVFARRDGVHRSLNTPGDRLRTIIHDNNLKPYISLHGLRKSFITNALQAKVAVPTVQRLAGHSDPTITLQVYSGMNQAAARKGINALGDYLND
jgi:integrase